MFRRNANNYSAIETVRNNYDGAYHKTVSVVIPCYNGEMLLRRCLASLAAQTYPGNLVEVIVCDDGSDDDIRSVVTRYSNVLNTRYIHQPRAGWRLSTARNSGILLSDGEIILSLDSDIMAPPGWLEEHLKWFHVANSIASLGTRRFVDASTVMPDDLVLGKFAKVMQLPDVRSQSNRLGQRDKRLLEFELFKHHPYPFNCFHGCNVAYRKCDAVDAGMFDESFNGNPGYEDIEFGLRLWKLGAVIVYEPRAFVFHQENGITTSEQRARGHVVNRQLLYERVPQLKHFRHHLAQD